MRKTLIILLISKEVSWFNVEAKAVNQAAPVVVVKAARAAAKVVENNNFFMRHT